MDKRSCVWGRGWTLDELYIYCLIRQNAEEAILLLLAQGNISKCNINIIATALCQHSIFVFTSDVFIVASIGSPAIILHLST